MKKSLLKWVGTVLLSAFMIIGCSQLSPREELNSNMTSSPRSTVMGSDIIGKTVSFVGHNGLYVVVEKNETNAPVQCDRSAVGAWEKFTIEDAGDGFIAFKAEANGMYLCGDKKFSGTPIMANRSAIGSWERFTWIDQGNNTVAIESNVNGNYWKTSGDDSDDNSVTAGASSIYSNSLFTYDVIEEDEPTDPINDNDREAGVLRTVYCDSTSEIHHAFSDARFGDKIVIASGNYIGSASISGSSAAYFSMTASGTENNPIWIVSEDSNNKAHLKGTSTGSDYVFYFTGDYTIVDSIKFSSGKKGIMLDNSDNSTIDNCEVFDIGEEGIHVRDGSSNTLIENCYVHDTGLVTEEYGEGIYVGSDYGKWGTYDAACDYVTILNNTIGPYVTAEHIDYKEGASHVTIEGNSFNGDGICDTTNGGTSFLDMKGNYGVVKNNTGYQSGNNLLEHAFEVHDKVNGWGDNNSFYDNTIEFDNGNTWSYIVLVDDLSSVSGSPDNTTAYNNTRSPSGNMYDL